MGSMGPPSYRVDSLSELAELGVDGFIVICSPDLIAPEKDISKMIKRLTDAGPEVSLMLPAGSMWIF